MKMLKQWKFKVLIIGLILFVGWIMTPQAQGLWNRGTHAIKAHWKIDNGATVEYRSGSALTTNSGSTTTVNGTIVLTNATITGTGVVSATHIADPTKSMPLPLNSAVFNNSGTYQVVGNDGTTSPGIAAVDTRPALVYADSTETASLGWTFHLDPLYSSGLAFRITMSSSADASYACLGLDWMVVVDGSADAFGTGSPETAVYNTVTTPSASDTTLTFTVADAGTISLLGAGEMVTVWFWNADNRAGSAKTTEIKAVEARYTATM